MKNSDIKIFLLSLGCSKNQVDSEAMGAIIAAQGWQLSQTPQEAQVIIVNTCGFIQSAKEESIGALLELAGYKQQGACQLLIAVGCLVQKYRPDLAAALPEIDAFLGSREYGRIAGLIAEKLNLPPAPTLTEQALYGQRLLLSPPYLAYIKIAEGCNHHCTYCLIPQLRGALRSRPPGDILHEAAALAKQGVKELVILAQDTTAYGLDIGAKPLLPQLLEDLAALPFRWIRLLYAYPDGVDESLLTVMARHKNICPYMDIPLQHGDNSILRAMGRRLSAEDLLAKIALIRDYLPNISLRSTMMVGFPGETEGNWQNMLDFLKYAQLDWLGAFAYSREEDTPAYSMPNQVDEEIKEYRLQKTLDIAAHITAGRLQRHIGQTLPLLAEAPADEEYAPGYWRGRISHQGPEVDGAVYFPAKAGIQAGDFVTAHIISSEMFDLCAQIS